MVDEMDHNFVPQSCSESPDPTGYIPTKDEIRKNGFYYYALSDQERVFYELALENKGLTHEIALLQAKIEYFALIYPLNMRLMVGAINALKGLMKVQYSIFQKDTGVDVVQKIGEFVESLGMPPDELKAAWNKAHGAS